MDWNLLSGALLCSTIAKGNRWLLVEDLGSQDQIGWGEDSIPVWGNYDQGLQGGGEGEEGFEGGFDEKGVEERVEGKSKSHCNSRSSFKKMRHIISGHLLLKLFEILQSGSCPFTRASG